MQTLVDVAIANVTNKRDEYKATDGHQASSVLLIEVAGGCAKSFCLLSFECVWESKRIRLKLIHFIVLYENKIERCWCGI